MTEQRIAIASFVKTPGLSPIKTRLAREVGESIAAKFYRLAVDAVAATLSQVASDQVCPYWAVAEEAGMEDRQWQDFARVSQGEGILGDRLGRVFNQLQARHEIVAVMGVDSPQVSSALLHDALGALTSQPECPQHVLGRCHDGGFYFLGTNVPLPRSMWMDIEWSSPKTADQIASRLTDLGSIVELPTMTDVDQAHDLSVLRRELEMVPQLTNPQVKLLNWLVARERAQD